MGEKYKISFWKHFGAISLSNIQKRTGAERVLILATKRKNVRGTALVGIREKLGENVAELVVLSAWEAFFYLNQKLMRILPLSLACAKPKDLQEGSYRFDDFVEGDLWVEITAKHYKQGKHNEENIFILVGAND